MKGWVGGKRGGGRKGMEMRGWEERGRGTVGKDVGGLNQLIEKGPSSTYQR